MITELLLEDESVDLPEISLNEGEIDTPRPSISNLVSTLLKNDPNLVHELQRRDKSQRFVAKQLRRVIQEHYSHLAPPEQDDEDPWPKEGAVAVAITRFLKDLRRKQEDPQRVAEVLRKGTTKIDDGMKHYLVSLDASDGLGKQVLWDLYQKTISRELSSVQLTEKGVEVYVKKLSEDKFLRSVEGTGIRKIRNSDLSHLKLLLPSVAAEVPGVLAHVGTLLADQGISIIDVSVHHSADYITLAFIVSEKHAARGREVLMKIINTGSRK
ncbi:MAG: ACT domain-containing protein [Candidatus Hodarchaeales archaeon]|jgi:hypothetical protein